DSIDLLDTSHSMGPYHHEGPYDCADPIVYSHCAPSERPAAALRRSNEQIIAAIAPGSLMDMASRHYPVDNVAKIRPFIAVPGAPNGLHYEEECVDPVGEYRCQALDRWTKSDRSSTSSYMEDSS
ncbi:hypothetical protein V1511DRAFT_450981, partial [Dipodascopsis uninucleata]